MTSDGITRRSVLKHAGTIGTASIIAERAHAAKTGIKRATSEQVRIPVAVTPTGPKEYEIAATLTVPPEKHRRPVTQLLVHGTTYAQYYYDFPYKPQRYSYVTHATEAGYPTLNIDRIGSGESSHPPPEHTTLETNAVILHQLIQVLRAGAIDGIDTSEVMLVGHGYGALVGVKQQAQYSGADYLTLTGYTQQYAHLPNLSTWLSPPESISAQQTDIARFDNLPQSYRTTRPGERTSYYYEKNADPAVITVDDRHKETVTETELETATEVLDASLAISVPVLEVVGDQDSVFCGAKSCTAPLGARTTEPLLWPEADFTMKVLPGGGHALFLHQNAPTTFSWIETWANEYVGK